MGLCFAMFVFLTFRGPLASHDSNPYPNRSRIARYNATKLRVATKLPFVRPKRAKSALSTTGYFLTKAESVGVGAFSPLPNDCPKAETIAIACLNK